MAELVGGAVLGAVVGIALTTVIDLSKQAWRCSNVCVQLACTVESARPHVEAFKDLESRSCQEWLQQLKDLLDEAKDIMEKYCVRNSKRWMVSRVFPVYKKKSKLSSQILEINERIMSKVGEVHMLIQIHRTTLEIKDQNTKILKQVVKSKDDKSADVGSSNCYIPRVLPSNIVSSENDPFQELKSLIMSKCDLEHPPITLGLRGCGGIGKTLVAQMLHNDDDIKAKYGKEFILWVNVGRDANLSQVYEKMEKFLNISFGGKDLDDQFTSLVDAFQKRRVLLILDDVWDENIEGKSLMERVDVAKGKGSVTLVTTRSVDVLQSARAKQSISIPLLSPEKSWELFYSHAFGSDVPISHEIGEIATQVCKKCGGLPLALEVIGASMYGKGDVLRWKHALGRLSNLQGKDKVLEKLKYSYEDVEKEEQMMFLYFAAFPEDFEIPTKMLCSIWHAEQCKTIQGGIESVYLEGMEKLFTLADRSLIKLSEDAEMATIHDILRELAMDIIRKINNGEYYFHAGKALKGLPLPILKGMKRMSLIGSSLDDSLNEFNRSDLEVLLLSGLHAEDREINTISKTLSKSTNLRYLDFSSTRLKILPNDIEKLSALMYLDLSWCYALNKLPTGMGKMKALTSLDLSECISLQLLPEDTGELKALTSLILRGCRDLEKLPKGMGKMKALTSWDLSECISLQLLPEDIGELEALISLNLKGCRNLEKLPEGMGKMKALTFLDLSECIFLPLLPEDIWELNALTSLILRGCRDLEKLPKGMGKMKALTSLDLSWCESLQLLPEDIGELEALISLDLKGCRDLEKLPEGMGKMKALTSLDLSWCKSLELLPEDIGELKALTSLNLSWCEALEKLPEDIGELKALRSLNLSSCKALEKLPEGMGKMKALISLDLLGCISLKLLPEDIRELKALTSLNLSWCVALEKLPKGMGKMKALTSLDLSWCKSLQLLPEDIGELKALTSFLYL